MKAIIKDKYVLAMEYLHRSPHRIKVAWLSGYAKGPFSSPGAPLFQAAGDDCNGCACLTLVRDGFNAATPELTAEIRADKRLPKRPEDIRPEHLNVFAEWQRRLDAMGVRS